MVNPLQNGMEEAGNSRVDGTCERASAFAQSEEKAKDQLVREENLDELYGA